MAKSILRNDAILVPIGTTSERPSSPEAGEIRFNTDENEFEGYDGAQWGSVGSFELESDLRGVVTQIGPSTSDYYIIGSTTHDWHLDGTLEMRLESGGDLQVNGDVVAFSTTTSDARLKTDVEVVEGALDKVNQLRGVEFTYLDDGRKSAGVIAQELECVLPSAVRESSVLARTEQGDSTLYKTVQYDQLHALLIESMKELSTRVSALETKLAALKEG